MKRIATALVLAAFALYSVFLAPPFVFFLIVCMMAALCYHEYAGIAAANGVEGPLWFGYAGGVLVVWKIELLPLVMLGVMAWTIKLPDLRRALAFASATVLGVVYLFATWRWAVPLREWSSYWILYALAINWVGDIAAYYVGRSIGKHKLSPNVSPGKSWEGAIASIFAATVFGVWFGWQFRLGLALQEMVLLSVVANIAGQVGDLAESALKRGAGVKDSGTLLPGHGGFLDRLDSTIFTLPVVYFVVSISR